MLTCYDASFAAISDEAGVDILLIGDSLGMVIQGHDSTLPVTMGETEYHVRCVARGAKRALIIADMPFGSFQQSSEVAFHNAARLMSAGAQMVKLEGGAVMAKTTVFLVERGIPVCAHIGLTPQSVHALGGYRVQGKDSVADLRKRLGAEASIALVPTMGNLHAGHLSLVEIAKQHGRSIVASIFVNRLQFEPGGDFDRYPRTLERDCELLSAAGCHVVFAPSEKDMYPQHQEIAVTPPKVAEALEGHHRPGHFQGVTTVVAKLFNIVALHAAVFGKKDYQH